MKCPLCEKDCLVYNSVFRCPVWDELNPDHRYEYHDKLFDSLTYKGYSFNRKINSISGLPRATLSKEHDLSGKSIKEFQNFPSNEEMIEEIYKLQN